MSTILKALKRLEEDGVVHQKGGGASLESEATVEDEALRGRIIAEEAAADALSPAPGSEGFHFPISGDLAGSRWVLAGATVLGLAVLGVGAGWFLGGSEDIADANYAAASSPSGSAVNSGGVASPIAEPSNAAELRAARARAEGLAQAGLSVPEAVVVAPVTLAPPAPPTPVAAVAVSSEPVAPPRKAEPLPAPLKVIPTKVARSAPVAPAKSITPVQPKAKAPVSIAEPPSPSSPRTLAAAAPFEEPAPTARSAASAPGNIRPGAFEIASTESTKGAARPSPGRLSSPAPVSASASAPVSKRTLTPLEQAQAMESAEVAALGGNGGSDVRVLRTSWHPQADRRSAKIRTGADDETMTVREGDSVAGLVIQEISPSSVLFAAGGVEIRRRVSSGR